MGDKVILIIVKEKEKETYRNLKCKYCNNKTFDIVLSNDGQLYARCLKCGFGKNLRNY